MATTPKKPTTPKAKVSAPKPATKPPVAVKKEAATVKAAPKSVPPEAPKLPLPQPVAAAAPKPAVAQPIVVEASKPVPQPAVADAPRSVPVIIAEPVPPTVPTKLSVVPPASLPVPAKKPGSAAMLKGYEDFTAFGKDSFDALVKANALFTKGLEDFGKEMLDIARTHMEEAAKLATAMLQAKTLHEVVEMHTVLTKNSLDKLVAESSALSELGLKVTNEAMAPLSAQMSKAVEKMRELAAA
ncbi:MAG TPA: TIGR01841 family phasin [Alphaproteobacteria bacterium]|nr:TIGR01841 family phasin [Alphaproteobacteria bacterium]